MPWQVALLILAALAAWIGRREPRCVVWLAAGAASFLASKGLIGAGAHGVTLALGNAIGDGLVLLAIAQARRYAWERKLYRVFVAMLACHALSAAGLLPPALPDGLPLISGEPLYASLLEALNLAAILIVGRAGWEARHHADDCRADARVPGAGLHLARRRVAAPRAWETWR